MSELSHSGLVQILFTHFNKILTKLMKHSMFSRTLIPRAFKYTSLQIWVWLIDWLYLLLEMLSHLRWIWVVSKPLMSSSWFSARLSDWRCFRDVKISCSKVRNLLPLKSWRKIGHFSPHKFIISLVKLYNFLPLQMCNCKKEIKLMWIAFKQRILNKSFELRATV
jgi:hypothetical protein